MRAILSLILFAILACTSGCAVTGDGAPAAGDADTKAQITGTRILQSVDADTRYPRTASPVYVISREDIDRTGEAELGDALRRWPFFR